MRMMSADRTLNDFAAELRSAGQAPQAEFLLTAGPAALSKTADPDHFTASCVVFDLAADDRRVLLQRHRKTGKWMQFGGHVEAADASFAAAAARELTEEAGLRSWRWFSPVPVSVTSYALSAQHGPVCPSPGCALRCRCFRARGCQRLGGVPRARLVQPRYAAGSANARPDRPAADAVGCRLPARRALRHSLISWCTGRRLLRS